mmetsp:Transcript_63502/g.139131  ORF Transcript_63502/g.139131 Transcript_63502/m.139131 type:complete len:83 (-) Transcript_63502:680-928(-)
MSSRIEVNNFSLGVVQKRDQAEGKWCPISKRPFATAAGPSRPGHCATRPTSPVDIEEMADAARVGKAAGDNKEGTYLGSDSR